MKVISIILFCATTIIFLSGYTDEHTELVFELELEQSKKRLLEEKMYEIKAQMRKERIFCELVEKQSKEDALIITISVPYAPSTDGRKLYLEKTESLLSNLHFFDSPVRLSDTIDLVNYSMKLSENYNQLRIAQVIEVAQNRMTLFGIPRREQLVRHIPDTTQVSIQLRRAQDVPKALAAFKVMGRLEFKLVKQSQPVNTDGMPLDITLPEVPAGCEIRYGDEDEWYLLEKEVLLTGEHIKDASVQKDHGLFHFVVSISFDSQGQRRFREITGARVNERLAILLDDVVKTAPLIREQIPGNAQIDAGFTSDEANDLVKILKTGAFPVPIRIVEKRTVAPVPGK